MLILPMQFCLQMALYGETGKMNEEFITKSFIKFLMDKGWEILSYDFPQSGTGVSLHLNQIFRQPKTKNEGMITPDIIAFKEGIGLISENKLYFEKQDIDKLEKLRRGVYSEGLNKVFQERQVKKLIFGIILPNIPNEVSKAQDYLAKVDFIFIVNEKGICNIKYLQESIKI